MSKPLLRLAAARTGHATRLVLTALLALQAAPGAAQEAARAPIVEVLHRSEALRLQALAPADPDSPRAAVLCSSFDKLMAALPQPGPARLLVVRSGALAQTMHGDLVVVRESMADMDERVRLFILAHEIGHVALQHWEQKARLYERWIPGEVRPETTDPVASGLGRAASAQAHEQEFAADAYAARLLQGLGVQYADLLLVFHALGGNRDTATHPAAGRRLAALREQMAADPR